MSQRTEIEELESGMRNLQWFADNYKSLQERYPDKFVAIDDGQLVEIQDSLDELVKKVGKEAVSATVVIQFVPAKDRIIVI